MFRELLFHSGAAGRKRPRGAIRLIAKAAELSYLSLIIRQENRTPVLVGWYQRCDSFVPLPATVSAGPSYLDLSEGAFCSCSAGTRSDFCVSTETTLKLPLASRV